MSRDTLLCDVIVAHVTQFKRDVTLSYPLRTCEFCVGVGLEGMIALAKVAVFVLQFAVLAQRLVPVRHRPVTALHQHVLLTLIHLGGAGLEVSRICSRRYLLRGVTVTQCCAV